MARKRIDAPAYRYHISGQARVTLGGKELYLGEYDSPESKAKYYALLAEYNANGKTVPESTPARLADAPVTVRCVTAQFRQHIEVKYAKTESHRSNFQNLCTLLEDEYGACPILPLIHDSQGKRKTDRLRYAAQNGSRCVETM